MAEVQAIRVGKWTIGYRHSTKETVLQFEWADRESLTFLITQGDAEAIARGILENYQTTPPKRSQMS